ncbi:polysaccharide biosynthesis C-terminal domain-containing protein, partial [candidate division KSB1 bacterium]|nr:polysaccharide biosynthesis C-terminal domain-containing protein [candidate division KSB1 bacterium]
LFALSIAILALYTAIHYAFNVVAAGHFPSEAQTTGFFGLFYGATGIGTLIVTSFLLRLLLRWIGAGNIYTWVCGAYLVVALVLSATFGGHGPAVELWTLFALNLANFLLLDSVVAPTYQVLIKLVPQRHSDGVRMIMEGGTRILTSFLVGRGFPMTTSLSAMLVAVSNLLLNLWCIPHYGIAGAAVAGTISYSLGALYLMRSFHRMTGISYTRLWRLQPNDFHLLRQLWQRIKSTRNDDHQSPT